MLFQKQQKGGYEMLFLLLAAAAGILMAVQGSINGALGKIIGSWEGNFAVHAIGLLCVAAVLFLLGTYQGGFAKIREVPWYLWLGGLINVVIIFGVMVSIAQAGSAKATTAIITGQLAMSMVIETFGWFGLQQSPFTWSKGIGVALMAVAAKLLLGK